MSSVCLLVFRDGRDDYHRRSLASAHRAGLLAHVDYVEYVDDADHALGFAGAVQRGWDKAARTGATHVFHLEADFTFNVDVNVPAMLKVLAARPHLAQIVLKRQPWSHAEIAAGGIIEQHPADYVEHSDSAGRVWTEHARFWSNNPCVYSVELLSRGWPQRPESEGHFGLQLLADAPHTRFAFWGRKTAPPAVHHIGRERAGRGY